MPLLLEEEVEVDDDDDVLFANSVDKVAFDTRIEEEEEGSTIFLTSKVEFLPLLDRDFPADATTTIFNHGQKE